MKNRMVKGCQHCGATDEKQHCAPNYQKRGELINSVIMKDGVGAISFTLRNPERTGCLYCPHSDCEEGSCKEYHEQKEKEDGRTTSAWSKGCARH